MYATEEERMKALKSQKRPWFCDICGKNYTLGGKTMHLKKLKHQKNAQVVRDLITLYIIIILRKKLYLQ